MGSNTAQRESKPAKKVLLADSLARQLDPTSSACIHRGGARQYDCLAPSVYQTTHATYDANEGESTSTSSSSSDTTAKHDPHHHSSIGGPTYLASGLSILSRLGPRNPRPNLHVPTFDDAASWKTVEDLAAQYGHVSHMGLLDRSHIFFINRARTAALAYKVQDHVAIISGHPLCAPELFTEVLEEFEQFRRFFGLRVVFMGAGDMFATYARQRRWTTMKFGVERVVNPLANDVLLEQAGKRILTQNKQLLSPDKADLTLGVYIPAQQDDPALEKDLQTLYDGWRARRNAASAAPQPFVTVYHLLDFANLMVFVYARGPHGALVGLAALRWVGANHGYHLDPCIAAADAPRGVTDLLVFAAMAFLRPRHIAYLSLGYEPLQRLGEVDGMAPPLEKLARSMYDHFVRLWPVDGKKAYHDKFRPDESLQSGLHMVFPCALPGPRQLVAVAHMANIRIRKLASTGYKSRREKRGGKV